MMRIHDNPSRPPLESYTSNYWDGRHDDVAWEETENRLFTLHPDIPHLRLLEPEPEICQSPDNGTLSLNLEKVSVLNTVELHHPTQGCTKSH